MLEQIPAIKKRFARWDGCTPLKRRSWSWGDRFEDLQRWLNETNGVRPRINSANKNEHKLALWLNALQYQYRKGELPEENVEQLLLLPGMEEIIANWRLENYQWPNDWKEWMWQLERWVETNGLLPTRSCEDPKAKTLATWLVKMRYRYHRDLLTEEQVARLTAVPGMQWGPRSRDESFENRCGDLEHWMKSHNGTTPRCHAEDPEEAKLAAWLAAKKMQNGKGKLSDARIVRLQRIGVIPKVSKKKMNKNDIYTLSCSDTSSRVQTLAVHTEMSIATPAKV